MEWYLKVLRHFADFSGRARRKEFWMFVIINIIIFIITIGLDNILNTTIDKAGNGYINLLYVLTVFIPALAVGVRRMHDIGKSGWMVLVGLIPVAGIVWLIILYTTKGVNGSNKYGPDPKEVSRISTHLGFN